ncbi:hypothetical protein ACHQM5_029892 [Ranunculus cassubicifolius]
MAEEPSIPLPNQAINIINPKYCLSTPINLFIRRKIKDITNLKFVITNEIGNVIFKVKPVISSRTLHETHLLVDDQDHPLLTIRRKIRTVHRRHQVYRGDSLEAKDLLFTVKKSCIGCVNVLDVMVESNVDVKGGSFRIQGSWLDRSCAVYLEQSPTVIAQMNRKHAVNDLKQGQEAFMVKVHPYVDQAFITTLLVIRSEINDRD